MNIKDQLKEEAAELSVLYVEDEPETQKKVSQIFALFFGSVTCAENGEDALEKYQNGAFDLVVTDLTMPKMDGVDFIKAIKSIAEHQRIIVITAHNSNENLLNTIELQVDGFLLKPIGMDKLLNLLYKVTHELYIEKRSDALALDLSYSYFNELSALKRLFMEVGPSVAVLVSVRGISTLKETFGLELVQYILAQSRAYLQKHLPAGGRFFQWSDEIFIYFFADTDRSEVYTLMEQFARENGFTQILYDKTSFPVQYTSTIISGEGLSMISKINKINHFRDHFQEQTLLLYESDNLPQQRHKEALYWVNKTLQAIELKQLKAFYQPIIGLKENQIIGYEALARIEDETQAFEPSYFLYPSEKAGIVEKISDIIYKSALESCPLTHYMLHLNISETELRSNILIEYLSQLSQQYTFSSDSVVLEVNYQVFSLKDKNIRNMLYSLKSLGYKILIEKFGEGQMDMYTLKELMPDIIKIDRNFLHEAYENEAPRSILKAFLLFAKSLEIKTAAIGIEDAAHLEFVKNLGFDYAQGYFLGRPSKSVEH